MLKGTVLVINMNLMDTYVSFVKDQNKSKRINQIDL